MLSKVCTVFVSLVAVLVTQISRLSHGQNFPSVAGLTQTIPGEFPWLVNIHYKNYHICDGSIITPKHILTAGSCLGYNLSPSDFVVVAGNRLNTSREDEDVSYGALKIITHPLYHQKMNDPDNNIGLIRLRKPIKFRPTRGKVGAISSIKLASRNDHIDYDQLFDIAGFSDKDTMDSEIILMKQQVKAKPCKETVNANVLICSDKVNENYESIGLIGTGLVRRVRGLEKFTLNGIASKIGEEQEYTKISVFREWIKDNLK